MKMANRKRSFLWDYYEQLNESFARCHFCELKLSYRTSLSNLKKHMMRKHPIEYENLGSGLSQTELKSFKTQKCHKFQKSNRSLRKSSKTTIKVSEEEDSDSSLSEYSLDEDEISRIRQINKANSSFSLKTKKPNLRKAGNDKFSSLNTFAKQTQSNHVIKSSSLNNDSNTLHPADTELESLSSNQSNEANNTSSSRNVEGQTEGSETFKEAIDSLINGLENDIKNSEVNESLDKNSTNKMLLVSEKRAQNQLLNPQPAKKVKRTSSEELPALNGCVDMIIESQKSFEKTVQNLNTNLENMTNAVLNLCKASENINLNLTKLVNILETTQSKEKS